MDKDELFKATRQNVIEILTAKLADVRESEDIENLIEYYADFMSCPSVHGLQERDCNDYSCKNCWKYAIRELDYQGV